MLQRGKTPLWWLTIINLNRKSGGLLASDHLATLFIFARLCLVDGWADVLCPRGYTDGIACPRKSSRRRFHYSASHLLAEPDRHRCPAPLPLEHCVRPAHGPTTNAFFTGRHLVRHGSDPRRFVHLTLMAQRNSRHRSPSNHRFRFI